MVLQGFQEYQQILDLYPEYIVCSPRVTTGSPPETPTQSPPPTFFEHADIVGDSTDNIANTDIATITATNNDNGINNTTPITTNDTSVSVTLTPNIFDFNHTNNNSNSPNNLNAFDYLLLNPAFEFKELDTLDLLHSSFRLPVSSPHPSFSFSPLSSLYASFTSLY